jgi:D-glycero-alpha-D-manno-heptose-7-phosphate kinase
MDADDLDSVVDNPAVKLHVGVYRKIIKTFCAGKPLSFRMTTYSDAPFGSGLGGSSTMVTVIIKAFSEWLKLPLGEYDIARLAWEIERVDLGLSGGRQDQYAATFGGFNFMEFYADNKVIVNPLRIKKWIINELEDSLILYYIGKSRKSAQIIDQQINAYQSNEAHLNAMHDVKKNAFVMKEALITGDFKMFGESLNTGWEAKKATADVISNPEIDKIYNTVIDSGGIAGKLSGAGGGGFFMFYVDPASRPRIFKILESFGGKTFSTQFYLSGTRGWVLY